MVVERLASICLALPEAHQQSAWTGTRWRIRTRTFAHVLHIEEGWPPVYAAAARSDGPLTVVMFRSSGEELDVLRSAGDPYFAPPWRPDEVGLVLGHDPDWDEVLELVTDSYCLQAPIRLAQLVERPET